MGLNQSYVVIICIILPIILLSPHASSATSPPIMANATLLESQTGIAGEHPSVTRPATMREQASLPSATDEGPIDDDLASPSIDSPNDILYEAGELGHVIVWIVLNLTPTMYEVLRNDRVVNSSVWAGGTQLEVSVDGLDPLIYNYTLVVHDIEDVTLSDTVFVTVVDTTAPNLSHPEDIEYEARTTTHYLTWNAFDLYPDWFEIVRNQVLLHSGYWTDVITISVDGLDPGVYNYTIILYDESDNYSFDAVQVVAVDTRVPVVSQPLDIVYSEGETGFAISWSGSDFYPADYSIYRNGSLVRSGHWNLTSTKITLGIDGLTAGIYLYQIVLTDTSENYVIDEVLVRVLSPLAMILPVLLLASIGILVVSLSVRLHKSRSLSEEDETPPDSEGEASDTEGAPVPRPASEEVTQALMEERERISARVKEESERRIATLEGSDTED